MFSARPRQGSERPILQVPRVRQRQKFQVMPQAEAEKKTRAQETLHTLNSCISSRAPVSCATCNGSNCRCKEAKMPVLFVGPRKATTTSDLPCFKLRSMRRVHQSNRSRFLQVHRQSAAVLPPQETKNSKLHFEPKTRARRSSLTSTGNALKAAEKPGRQAGPLGDIHAALPKLALSFRHQTMQRGARGLKIEQES